MLSLLKRSIAVVVLKSILPCILRLPLPIAPAPILTAIIATNPPPLLAFTSRQQAVEGAKNRYKRGNKAQAGSSNSQNTSQQPKSSPNNANSSTVVTESA
ncbi:hypothetical protein SERLA73DRAFT_68099 [Serpula lacrymans var. lacrymans S7.3]|uniref:Uncharacterized protein n=1 Tax=Serpula lacrymans var. lacrymans (strain S7.3) TaxID=936435 RepID=F8PGX7_SERL3|nr:hypothetical protein SERLA73DRAFT_68099 [Serpula lacrymans var. lacrymans S7.3]